MLNTGVGAPLREPLVFEVAGAANIYEDASCDYNHKACFRVEAGASIGAIHNQATMFPWRMLDHIPSSQLPATERLGLVEAAEGPAFDPFRILPFTRAMWATFEPKHTGLMIEQFI